MLMIRLFFFTSLLMTTNFGTAGKDPNKIIVNKPIKKPFNCEAIEISMCYHKCCIKNQANVSNDGFKNIVEEFLRISDTNNPNIIRIVTTAYEILENYQDWQPEITAFRTKTDLGNLKECNCLNKTKDENNINK